MAVTAKDLTPLLRPASVALVGCSPTATGKLGSWPLRNLLLHRSPVEVYPVNPAYKEIDGLACYRDLASLPASPDLVLVLVPAAASVAVLREAEEVGAKAAIVLSAGFGETAQGAGPQEELATFCKTSTLPVCGPNTDGVINVVDRIPCGFPPFAAIRDLPTGPVAVVSQSGALVSSLVMRLLRNGTGLSYSCAVGNAVDVGMGEFLAHFAYEERVDTLLVYIEGVGDRHRFLAGADEAIAAGKLVAVLKGGRSHEGATAAVSHTGALVGSYRAFRALCAAHGVVVVDSLSELAAVPILAPVLRRTASPAAVGVVAGSGAVGVLITDAARSHGLDVPPLSPATVARLAPRLHYSEPRNPLDLTGQLVHDPGMHSEVLDAFRADPRIGVIVASSLYGPAEITDRMKRELAAAVAGGAAVLVYATDGNDAQDEPILREAGIPVLASLDTLFRCMRALGVSEPAADPLTVVRPVVGSPGRGRQLLEALPAGPVPASVAWDLLERCGIGCVREHAVGSAGEAVATAGALGFPVVAKLSGPAVPHRFSRDLVRLALADPEALEEAWLSLDARRQDEAPSSEIVVQRFLGAGVEVLVGSAVDPEAGPVVLVGTGGVLAELADDVAMAPAPLDAAKAERLLADTRIGQVLDGRRRGPPVDRAALLDLVVAVSWLSAETEGILSELDLNPVVVRGDGAVAVDVLVVRAGQGGDRAAHR